MFYATFGYLDKLPMSMLHDPILADHMGWTVAMKHYTKKYNYKLPIYDIEEHGINFSWYHDSSYKDFLGRTLAMIMIAYSKIEKLDDHWIHDPRIKDKEGDTVFDYFIKYNV